MKRARRFGFLAAVIGLIIGVAGPALATPDNISQQIRGQGSLTTYHLMEGLSRAYNEADGCRVVPGSGTARLDEVCFSNGSLNASFPFVNDTSTGKTENWDHDVAIQDFAIGSGNGRNILNNLGNPGYPRIDFARSSSFSTAFPGFRFVAYAQDMLAYAVFVGNIKPSTDPTNPCAVDRSAGAVFDDQGPLGAAHGGTNGPGTINPKLGTWPAPAGSTCAAATAAGSVGGGQVVGGAVYPNLTGTQLKNIFGAGGCGAPLVDGHLDWHDLNAAIPTGTKIVVWADQAGSGTKGDFDGKLGSGCNASAGIQPTTFADGNFDNGERQILENVAIPISGVADPVNGGRLKTCQTVNRPTQTIADCAGTNTNGDTISYTQSIYYFAAGDWFASPVQTTTACAPIAGQCTANSNVNTGNQLQGSGTVLGTLSGVDATKPKMGPRCASPPCNSFSRFVYNAYRNATGSNDAPDWTRDFIGELGWICRPDTAHEDDPNTGVSYGTEIDNIIKAEGFALMPPQVGAGAVDIGGGVFAPSGTKCLVDQTS